MTIGKVTRVFYYFISSLVNFIVIAISFYIFIVD